MPVLPYNTILIIQVVKLLVHLRYVLHKRRPRLNELHTSLFQSFVHNVHQLLAGELLASAETLIIDHLAIRIVL